MEDMKKLIFCILEFGNSNSEKDNLLKESFIICAQMQTEKLQVYLLLPDTYAGAV